MRNMKNMQERSMQMSIADPVGISFIAELLPLLRRIHGLQHPASNYRLSKKEKAKLVRLAADVCLVKAAGGNAKWGKALRQTLIRTGVLYTGCAGIDHFLNVGNADAGHARRMFACLKAKRNYAGRPQQHAEYQLQTRRAAARAQSRIRPLHIIKWFKRCRKSCTISYRHVAPAAKNVDAVQNRRICKTYAAPVISAAALIACSSNMQDLAGHIADYNPHGVHVMAGQIEDLQKLIPGGTALMDPASLFEETALYILALQMQVHSLSALASSATLTPLYLENASL